MPAWDILFDVLVLLAAALVLGTVAEVLRQSAILGYLLAGAVVGPNILGLIEEGDHVRAIAELGVAMLLFTIGLEFSFKRLMRLGRVALVGGTLQVTVTLAVAAAVAAGFGMPFRGAVAVGAMIALSSTACVLRVLLDRRVIESLYGRNALGILLLQDIAVIPLMLLVIAMGGGGTWVEAGLVLGRTVLLGAALVAAFLLLFNVVIPRLLNLEQWARNRELPILLAIILALGSAFAAHTAALPAAVGAFVAGVLLGESPFATQIRSDIGTLRTLLVTLFFASIGMLWDPQWIVAHWYQVGAVVALIMAGKAAIVWVIMRALRFPNGIAAATGLCLAQVGEFSFVLAEMARGPAALIGPETFDLFVSATLLTLFVTPFLVAAAPRVADLIESRRAARRGARSTETPAVSAEVASRDIIIVGFGPAGQMAAQSLYNAYRDRMLIIELSPRNAQLARSYGLEAMVGDATHHDVLDRAFVGQARIVAITIPDPKGSRTVIQLCRRIAPNAALLVRSRYHVHRWELELAGAHEIMDEEQQVGQRIAAAARRHVRRSGDHGDPETGA